VSDASFYSHFAASVPPETNTWATLQTLCAFIGPPIDGVAAGFSLATSRVSSHPSAAKVLGAISGGLWLGGAVVSELGNVPRVTLASVANGFCGVAGAFSLTAPFLLDQTQRNVAYSSAAAWLVNGAADIACAVGNSQRNLVSRLLQGGSGAANMAAAGLSAASVDASARNDGVKAATLGTVSSMLWVVGAAAALGAESAARSDALNRTRRPGSEPGSAV